MGVKAQVLADLLIGVRDLAGSFYFSDNYKWMTFCCPCGCKSIGSIAIRVANEVVTHPSWEWDGDENAPTLTPSIRRTAGCKTWWALTQGFWDPVETVEGFRLG